MKPEWIEYAGSDEQIAEILNSKTDVLFRVSETCILKSKIFTSDLDSFLHTGNVVSFLICNPHPRAKAARRGKIITMYTPEKTANYESLVAHAAHRATRGSWRQAHAPCFLGTILD